MTRLLVAEHFVWSDYPGLRAGYIYAGKPDLTEQPRGETHAVAASEDNQTVCGLPRSAFPHEFDLTAKLQHAKVCDACGVAVPQPG